MKIAYLINHQIWRNDGVTKKISVQVEKWRSNAHEVEVFCITRKIDNSILRANQYLLRNPLFGRLTADKELIRDINDFNPDIVYLRYDIWSATISRIISQFKTVAELNSLDVDEFRLLLLKERTIKSLFRYLAYVALRGWIFRRLAGVVGVTHEITEAPSVARYSLPNATIPNGIDLRKYATLPRSEGSFDRVRLFFIATPGQPWHGVDYIVELARRLTDFEFHIVGMTEVTDLKNLFWHGYLNQANYTPILMRCHAGIGSLALFRNNMLEACPLKVREYLAYGFPVILGYKDTAFTGMVPPDYVLELNLSKDGLTDEVIRMIRDFCMTIRSRIVGTHELEMIDANILEQRRLTFLKDIAEM